VLGTNAIILEIPTLCIRRPIVHRLRCRAYCAYDFLDQCPHRMACARCSFYMPKETSHTHLPEGKPNLLRLRQQILLNDAELAAVDDGVEVMKKCFNSSRISTHPTARWPGSKASPRPHRKGDYLFEIATRKEEDPTHGGCVTVRTIATCEPTLLFDSLELYCSVQCHRMRTPRRSKKPRCHS
jgi:hypothetical protein